MATQNLKKAESPEILNNNIPTLVVTPENVQDLEILLETEEVESSDTESISSTTTSAKKNKGLVEYLRIKSGSLASGFGRVSGTFLNQLVKAGMQTPIVKYLMNPKTLRKALNNDPVLKETYRIILTSEPVQKLMTPEALKIILESKTAKKVITPELILYLLNHDILAQFATPEVIGFIVDSEICQKCLSPEAILHNMESNFAKEFLKPEIIHVIFYSQVVTKLMDPDFFVDFLNTSGVKNVMTKEAIEDAFLCPGAAKTMNQETVDKVFGTEGAKNLLDHEGFRRHVMTQVFATILKMYENKESNNCNSIQ